MCVADKVFKAIRDTVSFILYKRREQVLLAQRLPIASIALEGASRDTFKDVSGSIDAGFGGDSRFQIFVYGTEFSVLFTAVYGGMYFFIGLGLLRNIRAALWFGAVLPAIGGLLAFTAFSSCTAIPFLFSTYC